MSGSTAGLPMRLSSVWHARRLSGLANFATSTSALLLRAADGLAAVPVAGAATLTPRERGGVATLAALTTATGLGAEAAADVRSYK